MARRIAAVVQRYGHDIAGGETLARQVLTRLSERVDVTVLTTCARDYVSWANHYQPGSQIEGRVEVRRFPVEQERPLATFNLLSRLVLRRRRARWLILPRWVEEKWIDLQGPYCPGLLDHIRVHRDSFDAFIFFTYLYYPTARGLPLVADKAILVPTAHDERPIYLRPYRSVFEQVRAFVFLTTEEQRLVNRVFAVGARPQRVAAMEIPTAETRANLRPADFAKTHGIDKPYLLYIGRVDVAKGAQTMFSYFLHYHREGSRDCLLVLIGDRQTTIPQSDSIRYLGFMPEEQKSAAILGCRALLLFSPYESFSISALEAMGLGRPVIVTSDSPVLKGHVDRSGAGFAVSTYEEFRAAADTVIAAGDELGRRGIQYVKENYTWENVEKAYLEMIDTVCPGVRGA